MDNPNKSLNNLKEITNIYENLTYFDQYGSSLLLVVIITIIVILTVSYCYIFIHIEPIKNDWINQRCKPYIIPFAGLISKPGNMTISEYTKQNFDYCSQSIMSSITGVIVEPITFVTNMLKEVANIVKEAINSIRGMINKIRTFFQGISEEIMGRIMNIMIPLQQIIISFKDMLSKVQGVMTAGLYTLLGSYYTLKSLMGAIAQFIIIILIAMAVMIAIFWIIPFTWGMAISMTTTFIALAIPMALMLAFMIDVLQVQTNLSIPSVKCFDKNTLLKMKNGIDKKIIDVEVGEKLEDGSFITAKIKVATKGSQMFSLNNVIVSDSHIVNYNNSWITVSIHPLAKKVEFYKEQYLYCLNTSSKEIIINDMRFTDWDEIYDTELINIENELNKRKINPIDGDIHKYLDSGFVRSTIIKLKNGKEKRIDQIAIGDILENGGKVYGLVEINGYDLNEQNIYYLGKNNKIQGSSNLNICDKKLGFTSTLDLDEKSKQELFIKEDKLYHLLTDNKIFVVQKIIFYDYNAAIDLFLEKNRVKLLSMKYV